MAAWKEVVLRLVKERVVRLEKTVGSPESQEVLTTASGKAALENLLKRFVLVSADKSENNTIVVCQRHYVQRIRAELAGVEGKAHTYRVELEKIDVIVEEQLRRVTEFGVKYGFTVDKAQEKLATLYWTAKMHKNPNAERFIASSSKCVTKVLSQFLSKCLKTVQTELKFLCLRKKRESKSSWSKYWIVNSSDEVVGKIKELNMKGEASSVGSFDFSTLYTKLEHERLKAKLKWAIETAFESRHIDDLFAVNGEEVLAACLLELYQSTKV